MRNIDRIILGLSIASKHNGTVQAEHDEVFISLDNTPNEDEQKQLTDAGWHAEKHMEFKWWSHNV